MIVDLLGGDVKKGDLMGKCEIPYHPSMDIHDASKIQTFMDSPRKYFYQYILGWQAEDPNIHLVFGSAWHLAMERLLISLNEGDNAYSAGAVAEAYNLFLDRFQADFPADMDYDAFGAKEPANAIRALMEYVVAWRSDPAKYRTLYTEVAGSVPISETRLVHFKLDSILQRLEDGAVESMEHKTTGRKTMAWQEQWSIILQPWVYTHALRAIFEPEGIAVRGVRINGAVLRKSSNEFLRMPVAKSDRMMIEGLWRANHYMDQIEWSQENMLNTSPDDPVMPAFPCNGQSCSKFGCNFSSFCASWSNPLARAETPPPGFHQAYWDPRREEGDAKYVVKAGETKITEVNRGNI